MYQRYVKRILDILLALVLLPIALPVMIGCGFLIWLEDRGPVLYCDKRLGVGGRPFGMIKLRSMRVNAPDLRNGDHSAFSSENDPRLTKVGRFIRKTSLDELPQILNVLKGNMSFIGPRPDRPEALACYKGEEIRKLDVRPGISGFSQAFYRNSIRQSEKFSNDVYYVKNISLFLDLAILFATFSRVFGKKNIYGHGDGSKPDGYAPVIKGKGRDKPDYRVLNGDRADQEKIVAGRCGTCDRISAQGGVCWMIKGEMVSLRALGRADAPKLLNWVNQPELRYLTGTVYPVSDIEHEKWFEEKLCEKTSRIFGIEEIKSRSLAGVIGLSAIDLINRNAELFLYIGDEANRGRGLGTDAVKTLTRFAFEEMNLHRVSLVAFSYNTRAIHVYEKAGFTVEGIMRECLFKSGSFHDKVMMALLHEKKA